MIVYVIVMVVGMWCVSVAAGVSVQCVNVVWVFMGGVVVVSLLRVL